MTQEFDSNNFNIVNEGPAPIEAIGIPYTILEYPDQVEGQLPNWKRTVNFIKSYDTSRPKGKQALLRDISQAVAHNPTLLRDVITNLDLVGQLIYTEAMPHIQNMLIQQVEQAASYRPNLGMWTPSKIEELVRLSLDLKGRKKEMIERIEAAIFNASQTPEEAIDIHYNAAWAMVTTTQADVREELFSILNYEKEWLDTSSFAAFLYFAPGANSVDDVRLARHTAINGALNVVGCFLEMSQGVMPLKSRRIQQTNKKVFIANTGGVPYEEQIRREKAIMRAKQASKGRSESITRYTLGHVDEILNHTPSIAEEMISKSFEQRLTEEIEEREKIRNLPWPASAIKNPDEPLRIAVDQILCPMVFRTIWESINAYAVHKGFEKAIEKPIQITPDINLDIIVQGYNSPELKQFVARKVYETLTTGKTIQPSLDFPPKSTVGIFDLVRMTPGGLHSRFEPEGKIIFSLWRRFSEEEVGNLSSIIELHRPILPYEQCKDIDVKVAELRQQIMTRFTKSVGKRGYNLTVADPALRDFGYTSINFYQEPNAIKVVTVIDGQNYDFYLDSAFRILLKGDIKKFQTPQDRAWLELITLSHLKRIMCTDDDEIREELVSGERQERIYKKQTVARGEHLRWQAPGRVKNFSQEAFLRCLQSGLPERNLYKINQDRAAEGRGGTVETGIWTYVKEVEKVDVVEEKPIKVSFAKTSDDIRAVINLRQVSDEELARLEQSILEGLELEIN